MVLPGTVLHPKDVQVGALLQARDPAGLWYNAKVIHKSGRGASVAATVHYIGFGPAEDEKFTARKAGLRVRLPAAALRAEQIHMVEENRVQELYDGRTDGRREDVGAVAAVPAALERGEGPPEGPAAPGDHHVHAHDLEWRERGDADRAARSAREDVPHRVGHVG